MDVTIISREAFNKPKWSHAMHSITAYVANNIASSTADIANNIASSTADITNNIASSTYASSY